MENEQTEISNAQWMEIKRLLTTYKLAERLLCAAIGFAVAMFIVLILAYLNFN